MGDLSGLAPPYREAFTTCDIILGYDVGRELCPDAFQAFFSRYTATELGTRDPHAPLYIMVVSYDQRSAELEAFAACCIVHRGRCDYQKPPAETESIDELCVVDGSSTTNALSLLH
jgi:hypothetical protein